MSTITLKFGDVVITKEVAKEMINKINRLQIVMACDNFLSRDEKRKFCNRMHDENACTKCEVSFIRTLCGY